MSVILTTKELEILVTLLKRHAEVGQYPEDSLEVDLSARLNKIYEIAKELEPIERI